MADSKLKTRVYSGFKGVDFSNGILPLYRSPDALNMYRDYTEDDCVQTRPGLELMHTFNERINGVYFYTINNVTHTLVHTGTKLVEWTNYPEQPATIEEIYSGLNAVHSRAFVFDNIFYLMDGISYLEYDGVTMKEVEGTVPTTSYYKNPDGSTSIDASTDSDLVYQPVNVLTPLRINNFIADGSSTKYQLDTTDLDSPSTYILKVTVNGVNKTENVDFTVDRVNGIVTFGTAPETDAEVNIKFSKTVPGYRNRILNCKLSCEFDNRIFFSGNKDYPNSVFHCELNDPRYIRDTAYYECGMDYSQVKAIIPGNNVLWVIKEIDQNSSSVYYMTPTLDSTFDKIYPSVNGNISKGCVSKGINFNDDVVFFSDTGLESIGSNLYSEQILTHKSSNVDSKMLNEPGYKNVNLCEWNGYLLCLIDSHVYLADSRQKFINGSNEVEYEWYYWELPFNISYIREYRQNLYLGSSDGKLFILNGENDNGEDIISYWTTKKDDFEAPSYTKTTNKRGNVANLKVMGNDNIKVDTIVDGVVKEKKIFNDSKGYIAYRVKDKKFKEIQLKFSSNKRFGLFSCTLQGFIAGYIKR